MMYHLSHILLLLLALPSIFSGVAGLPTLRLQKKAKPPFKDIVVFGDSFSDNGVSLPSPMSSSNDGLINQETLSNSQMGRGLPIPRISRVVSRMVLSGLKLWGRVWMWS